MNLSSLSESQQQQLQQLQQQFQQHQQQQQQQQQVQPYDPSPQVQPYDPSQYQSYDQSYYQQQYQSYYQPDYSNSYQEQPQPQQYDSTPIQPPGISAPPEPVVQQHNPYYPASTGVEQQQQSSSYPVPSGLNPAAAAAVAALAQLTQFAGTMDAAERAMAGMQERAMAGMSGGGGGGYGPGGGQMPMQMPPHMDPYGGYHQEQFPSHRGGRPTYRGGGRRGGGSFRGGGGRGNFGHRPPRTDGSNPQFQGRGRGRGSNRRFPQRAASYLETVSTAEPASASEHGNSEASVMVQGETPVSAPVLSTIAPGQKAASGKASSNRRQPQIAWCELCRVDCTSLDILEQHKNGKKHKKNLQRFEELQKAGNPMPMIVTNPTPVSASSTDPIAVSAPTSSSIPSLASSSLSELTTTPMTEEQNQQESLSESKSEVVMAHAENVEKDEENNREAPENISIEVVNDENKLDSERQNDKMEQPEVEEGESAEGQGKKRRFDRFETRKRGMNKKTRGGRGAKRLRTSDRPSRPVEPPKPKEVVPIICDLCNVKCDTPAVFQTHLGGKKHMSKLKRFQGHQAMFGPVGLQALYPPNPNTQPIFIPQVHQQTMYAPQGSFHQSIPYAPYAQHTAAVFEHQGNQNPVNHGAHVDGSQNDVPLVFEVQGYVARQEGQLVVGTEEKSVGIPSEPVILQAHAAPAPENTHVADYGHTSSSVNVTLPTLDTKTEDATPQE